MDYYLLSEQDMNELLVDIENFIYDIKEKIEAKTINEDNDGNNEENEVDTENIYKTTGNQNL